MRDVCFNLRIFACHGACVLHVNKLYAALSACLALRHSVYRCVRTRHLTTKSSSCEYASHALPRCSQLACFPRKNTPILPQFAERVCILFALGSSGKKGRFAARRAWRPGSRRGRATSGVAEHSTRSGMVTTLALREQNINQVRLEHRVPAPDLPTHESALDSALYSLSLSLFLHTRRVRAPCQVDHLFCGGCDFGTPLSIYCLGPDRHRLNSQVM